MNFRLSLIASAAMLAAAPLAIAQDRTAFEQQAREIYRNVVEIRSARGHEKVPEMVDYITGEMKAVGFTDEDIRITDYDATGEATQGLIVWYRAQGRRRSFCSRMWMSSMRSPRTGCAIPTS